MALNLNRFYIIAMVAGTLVPWVFFGSWIGQNGLELGSFVADLFVNGAASGFSSDLLITSVVLWVWSYIDGRQLNVSLWWMVIPATLIVGLSLAFPLYLYLRSRTQLQTNEHELSLAERGAA